MATADEYAAWIVKNQDKKGSPEFNTVAAAYQQAKQEESPAQSAPSADELNKAVMRRSIGASIPFSLGSFAPDVAFGISQVPSAIAEMATSGKSETVRNANQGIKDLYERTFQPQSFPGSGVARAVGQGMATAPLTAVKAATTLPAMIGQGAGIGGITSILEPVYGDGKDFWMNKAKQFAAGAGTGGGASGVFGVIGKAMSPTVSPRAKELISEGVTPTPGQILGGGWKATEEKATSMPLLGEAIKVGQRRGIEEYNRVLYKRALEPVVPNAAKLVKDMPVGNEGVAKVGDILSNSYEASLARSVPSVIDNQFQQQMNQLAGMVPASMKDDFVNVIKRVIKDETTPAGTITPSVFKKAESELGRLAMEYKSSGTASERELSMAFRQAQSNLRELMARYNPREARNIQAINNGWATLAQLETAAARAGAKDGIVSPAQYLNAVKASDKSIRDRAFARGEARNQKLAQAGDEVLSNKYPDSGTAGRALLNIAATGGLGAMATTNPLAAAGVVAGMLPYTKTGQKAIAKLLTERPELMALGGDWLKRLSVPAAIPAAGLLGP